MGVRGDMEQGGSLYKPKAGESGVEYGPKVRKTRLLPFEKHLIEVAGCTEEEYIRFTEEVRKQSKVRPAGYEHIPEVVAGPGAGALALYSVSTTAAGVTTYALTWLGQLVVGIVLSYVAYLLTPKPKAPDDPEVRQLGDIRGRSKFAPTVGFESQAVLADYGAPIPIVFGLYRELGGADYGGLFISPPLVWSRMFSHGRQQSAKLMFVIGESGAVVSGQNPKGITKPDLKGIYIGRTPLESIYNNIFAFYWKTYHQNGSNDVRIKVENLEYGTRGSEGGDPQVIPGTDPYVAPVRGDQNSPAFCSTHSLTNNASFGCYAPIPNGTPYRVNWRIIPMPEEQSGPGKFVAARERVKIAGRKNMSRSITNDETEGSWHSGGIRLLGMEGIGRNYSRRMGIIKYRNSSVAGTDSRWGYEVININKDDMIEFRISHLNIPKTFYSHEIGQNDMEDGDMAVRVDDINSYTENERSIADNALQVGELFTIGGCTFVVTRREMQQLGGRTGSSDEWLPPTEDDSGNIQSTRGKYWLKCIEVPIATVGSGRSIGVANIAKIVDTTFSGSENYVRDMPVPGVTIPGVNFYPLMKESRAIVKNTRVCDTTEIGIRSRVFQQLNGICNFQTLPSKARLRQHDADNVQLSEGTSSTFIARASYFRVEVKKENQTNYSHIPLFFAVVGNTPVDVYNWISFTDRTAPSTERFTFRFVPEAGSSINRLSDTAEICVLSASGGKRATNVTVSGVSDFRVQYQGMIRLFGTLKRNKEFTTDASDFVTQTTSSYPNCIGNRYLLPADEDDLEDNKVTELEHERWYSVPTNTTEFVGPAFMWEILGAVDSNNEKWSSWYEEEAGDTNREVKIRFRGVKTALTDAGASGQTHYWRLAEIDVDSTWGGSDGGFTFNSMFLVDRNVNNSNPFKTTPGGVTLTKVGSVMRVRGISRGAGTWSRMQAFMYELFGRAHDNQTHQNSFKDVEKTYNSVGPEDESIRIRYRSTVRSGGTYAGETWFWNFPTIDVVDLGGDTDQGWDEGDEWDATEETTSNNPFRYSGVDVGFRLTIDGMSTTVALSTSETEGRTFDSYSQSADVSFYNGVTKSNDTSPEHTVVYVNEIVDNKDIAPNFKPVYDDMTIAGLALKAGKQFNSLDQINLWLKEGVPVKRFHPDRSSAYGNNDLYGPSNLLTDLVYYLLTDLKAGAGNALNAGNYAEQLIVTSDLIATSKFLYTYKLFFNGAIDKPTNIRQFLSQTAPMFLCNFVISNGKFSLVPALPTTSSGTIHQGPVDIRQLFTSGNILENTFKLSYLGAEERKPFIAIIRYTQMRKNDLPEEQSVGVRYSSGAGGAEYPPEVFDLTRYCNSREHAVLVAKFFLAIRKHITHTIEFETIITDLMLAPGDYIKVVTAASPYSVAQNGSINASGVITSNTELTAGRYDVTYYATGSDDVDNGTMTVGSDGKVVESAFHSSVFTVRATTTSNHVYLVEQLTITEDNTVRIVASEFPCDTDDKSMIVKDFYQTSTFKDTHNRSV